MKYYAHSGRLADKSDWQLLSDHLQTVAEIAQHNARYTECMNLAHLAGLLHDLGKYCKEFQARLEGSSKKVDHATAGAKTAAEILPNTLCNGFPFSKLIAYAIAGHHAGLANGLAEGEGRSCLENRLNQTFGKELCELDDLVWENELKLPRAESLMPKVKPHPDTRFHGFQYAFFLIGGCRFY